MTLRHACHLILFLSIVNIISCKPHYSQSSKLRVGGKDCNNCLVDEFGRFRVFHGLNQVEKGFPWYPSSLLNETRVKLLSQWGFNTIRLGTMWSGVEIAPYKVNSTYIKIMTSIVQRLDKYGISAILDMHQDCLSSAFNQYDGAPRWLIDSLTPPPTEFKYPFPLSKPPSAANWGLNCLTYECGDAYEQIYQNISGAVSHLEFFWKTVAQQFGKYTNVLGYELINEPWPGNVYKNPLRFLPGYAGEHSLMPLYDRLAQAINQVDNSTLIFYEPVTWGMIFEGNMTGTGFSHVPDHLTSRAVLSFHYYCWAVSIDSLAPFPEWKRQLCDSIFLPQVLRSINDHVSQIGGSSFLTEFGECQGTKLHNSTEYIECLSVLNGVDDRFFSWTYWDSGFFDGDGNVDIETVKLFSRTYAPAIAGKPLNSLFDQSTAEYELTYIPTVLEAPTIIFVSPVHCPNGFTVSVSSGLKYSINGSYVEVMAVQSNLPKSTVQIKKK